MTKYGSSLALFLVLAFSALSILADVNIDCGSSTSYVDANYIEWVGDGDYTESGKPMTVTNPSSEHVMNTLQLFPTGKQNCYSIPTVSQTPVLVRASFYYGNYDKKSSPPTFDLLLGTNHWETVVTSGNDTERYEAIYVVWGSSVSVCVSQTSDNFIPFMSALEIRSMGIGMYQYFDPDTAIFKKDRSFFSDTIGSLLLDSNGRIWESIGVPSDMILQATDSFFIIGETAADDPPQEVMQDAATVQATSQQIHITSTNLPATDVAVYVNMYFSELTYLDPTTQQRSFNIYVDDQLVTDQPIAPPYGSVYEYAMYNFTANSSTLFTLTATADSTLPPIINAFEVFAVSDVIVQTNGGGGTTTTPSDTTGGSATTNGNNTSGSKKKQKKSKLGVILGTTIPCGAVFSAMAAFLARRHKKRQSAAIAAAASNALNLQL